MSRAESDYSRAVAQLERLEGKMRRAFTVWIKQRAIVARMGKRLEKELYGQEAGKVSP